MPYLEGARGPMMAQTLFGLARAEDDITSQCSIFLPLYTRFEEVMDPLLFRAESGVDLSPGHHVLKPLGGNMADNHPRDATNPILVPSKLGG